jgi:hypothetical protein
MGRSVWLVGVALTLLLSILGVSVGCGESPPVDTSLLTGEPCQPPCWQGLTPGLSTQEEVNEFTRTSGFVNAQTLYPGRLSRGGQRVGVSMQWRSTTGRGSGSNSFAIEDGVLKYIIIYPDYDLTLENLIDRYGTPGKFRVIIAGSGLPYLGVTLFYPTHGFTATVELPIDDAQLLPESIVSRVWYFQAAPLERFIELGCEVGFLGSTPEKWLESLRDWQGYGAIEIP